MVLYLSSCQWMKESRRLWMNWLMLAMFPFFSVSNDGSSTQISWNRLVFSKSNLNLFVPSSILSENNEKTYLCPQYNHLFVFSRKNGELNCTQNWSCKLGDFHLCVIWLPDYPLSWWTLSVSYVLWSRVWSYCTPICILRTVKLELAAFWLEVGTILMQDNTHICDMCVRREEEGKIGCQVRAPWL